MESRGNGEKEGEGGGSKVNKEKEGRGGERGVG